MGNNPIKTEIQQRFGRLALSPQQERKFPVGPESAKRLGYEATEIDALPTSVTESFAGVGNPLDLGELRTGSTVLDLGCGAGLDSILAARRIGPTGTVVGIDFAVEMIVKAKRNAETLGLTNTTFREGEADALLLADDSVDVVISNGLEDRICRRRTNARMIAMLTCTARSLRRTDESMAMPCSVKA